MRTPKPFAVVFRGGKKRAIPWPGHSSKEQGNLTIPDQTRVKDGQHAAWQDLPRVVAGSLCPGEVFRVASYLEAGKTRLA